MDNEAPVTRLDRIEEAFLDCVVDKAPVSILCGAVIVGAFIAVEQLLLLVTK